MERNRALDEGSHATSIRAIPLLLSAEKKSVTIKMNGMPEIPDKAVSFEEMGRIMDNYDGPAPSQAVERGVPAEKAPKKKAEDKDWKSAQAKVDKKLKANDDEYEALLRQLEDAATD